MKKTARRTYVSQEESFDQLLYNPKCSPFWSDHELELSDIHIEWKRRDFQELLEVKEKIILGPNESIFKPIKTLKKPQVYTPFKTKTEKQKEEIF